MDFAGKILISTPSMDDPRFARSIIYLCAHTDAFSMGLVANKPARNIQLATILEQFDIEVTSPGMEDRVYLGGPVEPRRGFVLHSDEYEGEETVHFSGQLRVTASIDVLEDMAKGSGPRQSLLTLGYAGWGPGQLLEEIKDNSWLLADADPDLVLGTDDQDKWSAALRSIGVDANTLALSSTVGRA